MTRFAYAAHNDTHTIKLTVHGRMAFSPHEWASLWAGLHVSHPTP